MSIPVRIEAALNEALRPWCSDHDPGLAVGLRSADGWVWRRGAGLACVQSGLVNTPATRMRVGSISKQFVCVVVFMLEGEGRLDLASSVRDHFPELPAAFQPVSVRNLMTHTNGIWCHFSADALINGRSSLWHGRAAYPPLSDDDVFGMVLSQAALSFTPGERFDYSNGAYVLLTRLIEKLEGARLESVLQERLFRPIGMHATGLVRSDALLESGMATLHVATGKGYRRGIFPVSIGGEGGVVSTIDDLLQWIAHLRAPVAFDSSIAEALDTPVVLSNGYVQSFRYGLMRDRYRGFDILYHDGGVVGGSGRAARIPALGLDLAILANRSDVAPAEVSKRLVDAVLTDREETPAADPPGPEITGRYHAPGHARLFEFRTLGGQTAVDMFGMVAPLVERDGALVCDLPGSADIRFRVLEGGDAPVLELDDCGWRTRLRRLDDAQAKPAAGPESELCGRYRCVNTRATAHVSQVAGQTQLETVGPHGVQRYGLRALAPDLWSAEPLGAAVNRPLLEARRRDGWIVGFDLAAIRVKLDFERES